MKHKFGFTLAEILIVLMVIGVIATLTIPAVMKGVTEAQFKAGYKKAYHDITNLATAEKTNGQLPYTNKSIETMRLFKALNSTLSVVNYASIEDIQVNSGTIARPADYKNAIEIDGRIYGSGDDLAGKVDSGSITTYTPSPWIITEDNMAYSIICGGETGVPAKCGTKAKIAAQTSQKDAVLNSCAIVIVDVNGLSKGPNMFDPQIGPDEGFRLNNYDTNISNSSPLNTLTGDQYIIFLGIDGASAGSKDTVSGRIMADLK